MATFDLRPLTLGELLDRTFVLYRQNFLLFTGIAAIPYSALLVVSLGSVLLSKPSILPRFPARGAPLAHVVMFPSMVAGGLIVASVGIVAFLFSIGASVSAVSEIYLGRSTSIVGSLKGAAGRFFAMLGVSILSILIIFGGSLLFIIPGFIFACRTSIAIVAAVLEKAGPGSAIRRSFQLTKGFAGRAFMIYLLYFALAFALGGALQLPFGILMFVYAKQPGMLTFWMVLMEVGNFLVRVLVAPIGTISTSLYYYDLRVRKEAFDLQMMMQSIGGSPIPPPIGGGLPSTFGPNAF